MTDAPPTDCRNDQFFDRLNLDEVQLSEAQVCGGGSSLGRHRHEPDEEEFCLVLNGQGVMWRNGEEFPVRAGDLIRNPPEGEHSLHNLGPDTLRIFVFEVSVNP
jgi:mannose-6-phosphate isomerase-like protein (cupin superfamily)